MTATTTAPDSTPTRSPTGPFHHLMRPRQFTAKQFLEALSGRRPAEALCGVVRHVHPNPTELPLCPDCQAIRTGTTP